jgi:prepilin-type N-terminal cleavage/methylation domain-containing protein
MRRSQQGGFTLIELMVAVVISPIAMYFIFSVSSRMTQAMRVQTRIGEVTQTLVAAQDVMGKDLRAAGYLSSMFVGVNPDLVPGGLLGPLRVVNGGGGYGSDFIAIGHADLDGSARISKGQKPAFPAAETSVDSWGTLNVGDVAMAIRVGGNAEFLGKSCIIQITQLNAGPKIQHNPGVSPFNSPSNQHCKSLKPVWSDGYTVFARYSSHAYRIRPGDPRGVLEMSPSGALIAGDWQPLAMGVVDLQVAIRVRDDDGVDQDADGDTTRDWYSGDNMATILAAPNVQVLNLSLTLVARTTAEITGAGTSKLPAFSVAERMSHNQLGDRAEVTMAPPITKDPADPHYGNHAYRWTTTMIDLRNLGVGQ